MLYDKEKTTTTTKTHPVNWFVWSNLWRALVKVMYILSKHQKIDDIGCHFGFHSLLFRFVSSFPLNCVLIHCMCAMRVEGNKYRVSTNIPKHTYGTSTKMSRWFENAMPNCQRLIHFSVLLVCYISYNNIHEWKQWILRVFRCSLFVVWEKIFYNDSVENRYVQSNIDENSVHFSTLFNMRLHRELCIFYQYFVLVTDSLRITNEIFIFIVVVRVRFASYARLFFVSHPLPFFLRDQAHNNWMLLFFLNQSFDLFMIHRNQQELRRNENSFHGK